MHTAGILQRNAVAVATQAHRINLLRRGVAVREQRVAPAAAHARQHTNAS